MNFILLVIFPAALAIEKTVLINGGGCGVATREPGGIVVSHDPIDEDIPISNDINCLFSIQTFRPRQDARLVFDHLSLTPNDCSQANIEVYNDRYANDSTRLLTPTLCPGDDVSLVEFISDGNWLTIKIVARFVGVTEPKVNFSASYASFTAKPCRLPDQETECTLDRCIYNELLCDGVDACGDGTDESTDPPANCNVSSTTTAESATTTTTTTRTSTAATTGSASSTAQSTVTTGTSPTSPEASDLTPLIVVLVIAGVCLSVYVFYILMSFSWFNKLIFSCLRSCLRYCMRRHRDYKRKKNEKSVGNLTRISPEPPTATE